MLRNNPILSETVDTLCKIIPIVEIILILLFIFLAITTK